MTDNSNSNSNIDSDDETTQFGQNLARIAAGGYDDAQGVRKSTMNRVRDLVRKRNEGIPFDEVEDEKDPDERSFESKYSDDNLPDLIEQMLNEGKLNSDEFGHLQRMLELRDSSENIEDQYKGIMELTEGEPIFTTWLHYVYGVSTTLTAKLVHRYGYCEKFDRVSQMWKYSGLAPGQQREKGKKLGFDPDARTLAWLVADRIVMQGVRSEYKAEFYDPYKEEQVRRMEGSECHYCGEPTVDHDSGDDRECDAFLRHVEEQVEEHEQVISRLESSIESGSFGSDAEAEMRDDIESRNDRIAELEDRELGYDDFDMPPGCPDEATPPWSQGHADNRARRYLAKKFLKHYWTIARDLKGLDTPDEWVVTHGGHDKRVDTFENPLYARRVISQGATPAD